MMFPYPVGGRYAPGVGQSARIGSIRVINHNFLTVNTNNLRFARHVARIIGNTVEPLTNDHPTNDHPSHTTTFRVTDSGFCSYTNPSRATIPLIRPHQCDSEGGRIRGILLYIVSVCTHISFKITSQQEHML